jgi:hypothetical protein
MQKDIHVPCVHLDRFKRPADKKAKKLERAVSYCRGKEDKDTYGDQWL